MAENKATNPFAGEEASSDEYGFDERHDPLHKDEAQARAAKYGIYGYESEPGEAYEGEAGPTTTIEGEPTPGGPRQESVTGVTPAGGGQSRLETEQGAGFAQPMEEPQRSASQNSRPDDEGASGSL
jgi:hypothetical protein